VTRRDIQPAQHPDDASPRLGLEPQSAEG